MHGTGIYERWRQYVHRTQPLSDAAECCPPEHLLQMIWLHQRLRREYLTTTGGQRIQVLHPGCRSTTAGPDFRGAIIQFDQDQPRHGDIEIDRHSTFWQSHHHADNPAFSNVILHVVWKPGRATVSSIPTLVLAAYLDAPLRQLAAWLGPEKPLPPWFRGRCTNAWQQHPEPERRAILRHAALTRLRQKAAILSLRANEVGWHRALQEGLVTSLGYSMNTWPMRAVAERIPRIVEGLEDESSSLTHIQARMLGVAGLLPAELPRNHAETAPQIKAFWDYWWRDQAQLQDVCLPRSLWRFSGVRPHNHPQRRLALAAYWTNALGISKRVEAWILQDLPRRFYVPRLLEVLLPPQDAFWSWHWTLTGKRLSRPCLLLGCSRAFDLAINVVLPWCWQRARLGDDLALVQRAEQRFLDWPKAGDNAILKSARVRMFSSLRARWFKNAAEQQGLMQLVQDFCGPSDALCHGCLLPDLLTSEEECHGLMEDHACQTVVPVGCATPSPTRTPP